MLDEGEFLSDYGIRSLSRYHADHPYRFDAGGQEYRVAYQPAESDSGMFGGNSNWRGPVWMPMNALIIRALLQYHSYYGNDFTIECPTGSGQHMTLYEVAHEIGAAAGRDLPVGRERPPPGLWWRGEVPGRSALAGQSALLRVLPRRQRCRPGRQPSDGLDRRHRSRAASVRDNERRRDCRPGPGCAR